MFDKLKEHKAEIALGLGVTGFVCATGLGIFVTIKQTRKVDQMKTENEDLTKKEIVKAVAPGYIPVAALIVTSVTCIIFAGKMYISDTAALATTCQVATNALKAYKGAVEETLDEKQRAEIESKYDEKLSTAYCTNLPIEKDGKRLFIETAGGREFYLTQEELLNIKDTLSEMSLSDEEVCMNDFYDCINLEPSKAGEYMFFPKGQGVKMRITSSHNVDGNWNAPLLVHFDDVIFTNVMEPIYRTY